MKYTYNKLRGKIVEVFGTHYRFAKALGISENSLSKKLKGKTQFKQSDITKWCLLLSIPIDEAGNYFFS